MFWERKNKEKIWNVMPDNSLKKIIEDERGAVYRIKIENTSFNVIYTKSGGMRGADMHPTKQFDLIIKGEFEIWLKKKTKIVKFRCKKNDLLIVPPKIPHLFKCLQDSIMIEWWNGPFKQKFYPPFRKLIETKFPPKKFK